MLIWSNTYSNIIINATIKWLLNPFSFDVLILKIKQIKPPSNIIVMFNLAARRKSYLPSARRKSPVQYCTITITKILHLYWVHMMCFDHILCKRMLILSIWKPAQSRKKILVVQLNHTWWVLLLETFVYIIIYYNRLVPEHLHILGANKVMVLLLLIEYSNPNTNTKNHHHKAKRAHFFLVLKTYLQIIPQ